MLTLRGQACLQQADVVLHDYLANPRLLNHAEHAEKICLGKHGTGRIFTQQEINQQIVELATSGKIVVRLKGGDPAIFARAHEELEVIRQHRIPYEIVPGITAALAVTSTVGIPLTHRDFASAVALVTGQGKAGGPETPIDYQALAKFPGTLVFYMGTTTVEQWSSGLIQGGMAPETPVVATRNCSLPTQSTFQCRLDEVSARVNQERRLRPPVLFVIGRAAEEYGKFDWFESRPLFGQSILVTRPEHQAESLAGQLEELGAEVLVQPAIQIAPVEDQSEIHQVLDRIQDFDWIVFSSANGVEYLMRELLTRTDIRCLAGCRIAAIGPATAAHLQRYFLNADLVPQKFQADDLAEALKSEVKDRNVLLIRASRGREVLRDELAQVAHEVKQLVCYESRDVQQSDESVAERLRAGELDFVTVTSSAIARSLHHLFGADLRRTTLVSISPVTSATLRELGYEPGVEAETYTMPGVVTAIRQAITRR